MATRSASSLNLAKAEAGPLELARALEAFLAEHPRAALLDDGRVLFDMPASHYSLSTEHGRCVLHLWSEERNLMRTVVGLEQRKDALRILVRKLGSPRPQSLQLVPDRDQRTPTARSMARSNYLALLERVLTRAFNDYKIRSLRSAMDLEHSFGPAYARAMLVRGQQSWAVLGVGAAETQATIDGALTLGILWLAHNRQNSGGRTVCRGLKLIVPRGAADTARARMAWLHPGLGAWELYELSEADEELAQIDTSSEGNLKMRLVHAFDTRAALDRAQAGIRRLMDLLPDGMKDLVLLRARGPHEVALSLYGLEFARVRHGFTPNSFARQDTVTFGAGVHETPLEEASEGWFADLAGRLFTHRSPTGKAGDPLFRLQAEGWLESLLRQELPQIEPALVSSPIYSQVPAFAAGDRGMLDLLTVTRGGRLAVVELKADEDLHLPLQALDYWIRVRSLSEQRTEENAPNELQRSGYFPGIQLLRESPLLYYIVPALRVHPSMETVLSHLSPRIGWSLIALNEGWRTARQVVFRRHARSPQP
ncbi:MAG TPA: hypothetical protein VGR96_19600 [Acidobacteriaceae bacterium]|nr:hypothetical protein [Acidobacteriaceae bacterium]